MSAKPHVIDVTEANFEADVINASMTTPVLLDFWAEWCGPCKTLGPIVEQLAAEYNGAFTLAKVNVDVAQQLAGMFGIQSIPMIILVKDGQLADGFPGAKPAGEIREFLSKHGVVPAQADDVAEVVEESNDLVTPLERVNQVRESLVNDAGNDELKLDLAVALLATGETEEAKQLIANLPANLATDARALRAQSHLNLLAALPAGWNLTDLRANGEADSTGKYNRSIGELLGGDVQLGLQGLIDLMRDDRAFGDDLARRSLIDAFRIIEDPAIVAQFRRKMSSLLF